ncbi:MAG: methyltransferase domain-containing protein [Hymenobacter sp.]
MQRLRAQGYADVTGIDVSAPAIELAQARGVPHVAVMDGANLEFADARFDLVIASDVLEHIEEEGRALREWTRVLRPGGQLLVFVPAHAYLWSEHDVVNHHFRRYSRAGLLAAMRGAGLRPQRSSFWNTALFFPRRPCGWAGGCWPAAQRPASAAGSTGDLHQFAGPAQQPAAELGAGRECRVAPHQSAGGRERVCPGPKARPNLSAAVHPLPPRRCRSSSPFIMRRPISQELYRRLTGPAEPRWPCRAGFELIFVNDGSRDGSLPQLLAAGRARPAHGCATSTSAATLATRWP